MYSQNKNVFYIHKCLKNDFSATLVRILYGVDVSIMGSKKIKTTEYKQPYTKIFQFSN